jgi:hypothetical protein
MGRDKPGKSFILFLAERLWHKQILNTVITDHGHIKVGLK